MTKTSVESPFTLKRVQELLGLSSSTVSKLVSAGFVTPARGARNEQHFSFRDLMLLRTAHALQQARIAPRKIISALAKLKADLPAELPLTGLRITAVGSDVVVRDRGTQWNPDTGQLVMDFEVADVGGSLALLSATPTLAPMAAVRDWFREGEAFEATDRRAAEDAYRKAIEQDSTKAAPYLNLGAILCEDSRCGEAVELYASAVETVSKDPLIRFNYAIALEDQARHSDALVQYERAIELDPELADAYFNAGILLERLGDTKRAIRHFSAYKRLERSE